MKQRIITLITACALGGVSLVATAGQSIAPITVSIQNNTGCSVEFSGLIGGYSSINPLTPASGSAAVILPDPGSNIVRGHMMVYSSIPGQYVDNIVFVARFVKQHWQIQAYDLYNKLNVVVNDHNQVVLNP